MTREQRIRDLLPAIAARLVLEGARDVSDSELRRAFRGCICPDMLFRVAKTARARGLLSARNLKTLAYKETRNA